jgi:hypothetical protein
MNEMVMRAVIENMMRSRGRTGNTVMDTDGNKTTMINYTSGGMVYGVVGTPEEIAEMTAFMENEAPTVATNIENQITQEVARQARNAIRQTENDSIDYYALFNGEDDDYTVDDLDGDYR